MTSKSEASSFLNSIFLKIKGKIFILTSASLIKRSFESLFGVLNSNKSDFILRHKSYVAVMEGLSKFKISPVDSFTFLIRISGFKKGETILPKFT